MKAKAICAMKQESPQLVWLSVPLGPPRRAPTATQLGAVYYSGMDRKASGSTLSVHQD